LRAITIRVTSLDYLQAQVSGRESGAAVNPTGNAVAMAFPTTNIAPAAGASDWKAATWDTDSTTTPATYRAQCLVGPGGTVELAAGTYYMFVKVTDTPEAPILPCGVVKVVP
jgi:hypothetical protein